MGHLYFRHGKHRNASAAEIARARLMAGKRRRVRSLRLHPPPLPRHHPSGFRSRMRHGNSPFGRKTRRIARAIGCRYTGIFRAEIFFLHLTDSFRRSSRTTKIPCLSPVRANFCVAGEAENRRLMSARVTAAELLSSVALAQEDARVRWHSHRHQSPDRAIEASPAFPCPPCRIHTVLTVNLTRNGRGRYP